MSQSFVGSYVDDVVEVLIASVLSRSHAILIGAPGWGKTAISRQAALRMSGGDFSLVRVDPSTPPEKLLGAYDPAALLDGRLQRVTENTPYDQDCQIGIIDELFRASDVLFDVALDTLDRLDTAEAPPMWATANFVATGTRVEALIDRIGLWLWIKPTVLDLNKIASAHLLNGGRPELMQAIPDRKTVEEIRQATPTENALNAVLEVLGNLNEEAAREGRRAHPRRVAQWSKILFSYAMYKTGSNDFTAVPPEAMRIMRYAWPCTTAQDAATWANIASSAIDPVATAIEEAFKILKPELDRISEIEDTATRATQSSALGEAALNAKNMLKALATNDPRIKESLALIDKLIGDAVRGKPVNL